MEKLKVSLRNCHGIRELETILPFGMGNAVAIYAPNGTMKTSFAQTFRDLVGGHESSDRMFPTRETTRSFTDEGGGELDPNDVVVVLSYDEELGLTESVSTLLVNPALRREYEGIQSDLVQARDQLVTALREQSGTKRDIIDTVSQVFMHESDKFFDALVRVEDEVNQLVDTGFADLRYDVLFNDKVEIALRAPEVQSGLAEYVTRLNNLLDESAFFNRNSFSFYNATSITKSLSSNGFFSAEHSLLLCDRDKNISRTVTSDADLKALIDEEKKRITDDETLRKKFAMVEKALEKNVDARSFMRYIMEREELLPEFANIDAFKQKIWKAYFKANPGLYNRVLTCYKDTAERREEIERQAAEESTQWEAVIRIFNDRFFVPFRLIVENKHRIALGQDTIPKVSFEFKEGGESRGVDRGDLLSVLSNGEKKALYILNVLFEMQARKSNGRETLFIIDDLADSFDYKNKYAIVQYLKEMAQCPGFRLVLLTHNFDFFRALRSRGVVGYPQCFMAQKGDSKVVLDRARHVKNPFIYEFKKKFFSSGMQRIASIPFLRNIVEYSKGKDDKDYVTLTWLLHWRPKSSAITNAELDEIFKRIIAGYEGETWVGPESSVMDLLMEQADLACKASEGVNFENKIVLAIASRIVAERYMFDELGDYDASWEGQTGKLFDIMKERGVGTPEVLDALESVVLMTPESIHVNAFMYEPIIDMSDAALRNLYAKMKELKSRIYQEN